VRAPAPQPVVQAERPAPPNTDEANLAEMAQRLEAALRRPVPAGQDHKAQVAAQRAPIYSAEIKRPEPKLPAEPRPEPRLAPEPRPEPRPAAPVVSQPAPQPKPAPAKPAFESLEQEMASLLGRPSSGKT